MDLGPVHMVSDSPPSRDNFIERLFENYETATKLTDPRAYILRRVLKIHIMSS